MGELVNPVVDKEKKSSELMVKVPDKSLIFQLMGYGAIGDFISDRTKMLSHADMGSLLASDNPLSIKLMELSRSNRVEAGPTAEWGLEGDYWRIMEKKASLGEFQEFEGEYKKWVGDSFGKSNRLASTEARNALDRLGQINRQLYIELIQYSLDERKRRIGNKWRSEEFYEDAFELSIEDWAKKDPVACMEFVQKNQNLISSRSQAAALKEVFLAGRDYGWRVAESLLHSPKAADRQSVYKLIDDDTKKSIESGDTPEKFINLYEDALDRFLVGGENYDFILIDNRMDLYLASCEISGVKPHQVFLDIETKKIEQDNDKERWLQQRFHDESKEVPDLILSFKRYDSYFSKDRDVPFFSNEGRRRVYNISKCLDDEQKKTDIDAMTVSRLREEARRIVNAGISEPSFSQSRELSEIREAVKAGDVEKIRRSVGKLYFVHLVTDIDPGLGGELLLRFMNENLVLRGVFFEAFDQSFDKISESSPETFVEMMGKVDECSTNFYLEKLENCKFKSKWRIKFRNDFDQAWAEGKRILKEGGAWADVSGVFNNLDLVFAQRPNEVMDLIQTVITGKESWYKARVEHLSLRGGEHQNANYDVGELVRLNMYDAAQKLSEGDRTKFILDVFEKGEHDPILRSFNPKNAMVGMGLESKKEMVYKLHLLELERNKEIRPINPDDALNVVGWNTRGVLEDLAGDDPEFVLRFLSEHQFPRDAYQRKIMNELIIKCLSLLPTSESVKTFSDKVEKLSRNYNLGGHDQFVSTIVSCVVSSPEIQISSYRDMFLKLVSINDRLDDGKRVLDATKFVKDNQERIAKLILVYPNPVYATSLILETAKQHGFSRLESKLQLLDSFSIDDVISIHRSLSKRSVGMMNQGLLSDLLGLFSAYQSIGSKDVMFRQLEVLAESPKLVQEVGQSLMIELSVRLGIDPNKLPDGSLGIWNFDYLPRLFEATTKFREDDKKIYGLIVKASMLGDFETIINPDKMVDFESRYTDEEMGLIEKIRNDNKLTDERFKSRNISLEAFSSGAKERRLTGVVSGQQMLTRTYAKIKDQTSHTLLEASRMVDIAEVEDEFRMAEGKLSSSVDALLVYMNESRPIKKEEEGTVLIEWEDVIRLLLGSGKTAEGALLGQDVAVNIRSGKFMKAFKWNNGKLVGISQDTSAIAHRIRTLQVELDKAKSAFPEKTEEIQRAESMLLMVQARSTKGEIGGRGGPADKSGRTDLKENVSILSGALDKIIGKLDERITSPNVLQEELDQLKTTKDHLLSRKTELNKFVGIAAEAKDRPYDLTLRRWRRLPGQDIFQGNYTSCCVAIDGVNGFAMLRYLVSKDVELTEVVDNISDETVGQSFEFVSERADGALAYTIDNCELSTRVAHLSDVIRDNIFEMAKETSVQMKIESSLPGVKEVIMGVSYNDVDIDHLDRSTRRIRKLGGSALGLKQYLDVFVSHDPGPGVKVLNPNGFHTMPIAEIASLETGTPSKRASINYDTLSEVLPVWSDIDGGIMKLERDIFGVTADLPEVLRRQFLDEKNVAVVARDESGNILGYTLGIDQGAIKVEGAEPEKVLFITSSAIDYDVASMGINGKLQEKLKVEAKKKGFKYLARNTMADNGYAQRIIREAMENGTLVEPKSIEDIKYRDFYGRPQIHIVTRIE